MASDEGSKDKKTDEYTECTVCKETFIDPRVLPCKHSFCLKCLEGIASASERKNGETIPCPTCRKEFTIPNDGFDVIPKNFFVEHVIETGKVSGPSGNGASATESSLPTLCDVCKSLNVGTSDETPPVKGRCLDCQENLCNDCERRHKVQKFSRDHRILEIGSDAMMIAEHMKGAFKSLTCEQHPSKILDYYCPECKKVVCISCFAGSHCSHKCTEVDKVSDEFRNEIQQNIEILSNWMALGADRMEILKKKTSEFHKRIVDSKNAILERSEQLKAMIDAHKNTLLNELTLIKEKRLKEIVKEKDEVKTHVFELESFSFYCNELISRGCPGDICQKADDVTKRTNNLKTENETICKKIRDCSSVFKAIDWSAFLKQYQNTIGTISVAELEETFVVAGKSRSENTFFRTYRDLGRPSAVSALASTPSDLQNDTAPGVASITTVVDNTLFVTGVGRNKDEIWGYDINNNWTKRGQHQERCNHSVTTISNKLYICGGLRDSDRFALDSVEAFDTSTNSCTTVGQLVHGVYSAASVAVKSSIYIFGGFDKDHKEVDFIQVYETVDNKCTLLKSLMPHPRARMKAALFEKSVILLGVDTCFIFNTETESWQERTELNINFKGVNYFEMILEKDKVFFVPGGRPKPTSPESRSPSPKTFKTLSSNKKTSSAFTFASSWAWQHTQQTGKCIIDYVSVSNLMNSERVKWQKHAEIPDLNEIRIFSKMMLPSTLNVYG